jgi:Na+-transporting NADH:ubiquinone oxidoreductase subunit F
MTIETTIRIRLSTGTMLEAARGVSLLQALQEKGIYLPSACGGKGICGFCRCRVSAGAGPVTEAETARLGPAGLDAGFRLACQVRTENDLDVEIPEALLRYRAFAAETTGIEDLTHDIKRVRFRLLQPREMPFKAGQYVQIQSRPYPGVEQTVFRSFSIASPPQETGKLDLIVRRVPNGICTTWIHDHLRAGERVTLVGPMGDFWLREGDDAVLVVAGGSGLGPILSILNDMAARGIRRETVCFFGAVSRRDLYGLEEMAALQRRLERFRFVPALSNPDANDQWEGETGLITEPLAKHLESADASKVQAYLCGSPGMIQACCVLLRRHGIGEDRTFFDPFT